MNKNIETTKRAHIYEIDLIRVITVFSVVTVHSLSTSSFLVTDPKISLQILNFIIHLFHYSRQIFMFVTGLVLTYSYLNRQFSTLKFWLRRLLLVFIPYVLWTLIYTKLDNNTSNINSFLNISLTNIPH